MSTKNVLFAIFFSCDGIAIHVLVPKDKSVTGQCYRDVVLKTVDIFPKTTLYNRISICKFHISKYEKLFPKSEKVTI